MPDTRFKPLPWTRLKRGVPCYLPRMAKTAAPVDANSPALRVMTDFQQMTPITIARDASLDDANRIMALCHVHYLLVADGQRQLQGIVTEAGTKGHRPLAVAHTLGVRPGELVVGVEAGDLANCTAGCRHSGLLLAHGPVGGDAPDHRTGLAGGIPVHHDRVSTRNLGCAQQARRGSPQARARYHANRSTMGISGAGCDHLQSRTNSGADCDGRLWYASDAAADDAGVEPGPQIVPGTR